MKKTITTVMLAAAMVGMAQADVTVDVPLDKVRTVMIFFMTKKSHWDVRRDVPQADRTHLLEFMTEVVGKKGTTLTTVKYILTAKGESTQAFALIDGWNPTAFGHGTADPQQTAYFEELLVDMANRADSIISTYGLEVVPPPTH